MKDDLQEIFKLAARYYYKKYRKKGGTQDRLAKKLGVTQSYVSSVITGTKSASLDLQSQIAHTLSDKQFEEFLAIGRRIKNGLDPEIHDTKEDDDSVESLITRLSHYVVDHQRIEGELVKMRDFYETIVESLQSGVIVLDANNSITYMNSYMEKLIKKFLGDSSYFIGVDAKKIIGLNYFARSERLPVRNVDALLLYYNQARTTREPVHYDDVIVTTSGGHDLWLTGWMIPLKKENNSYGGMVITSQDVTRLKKLNQSLLATTEYIPHPVSIALQDYENGPVTSFHFNKAGMEVFGIEQNEISKGDIEIALQRIVDKLENGEEWLAFARKNFGGVKFASMEILVKDGRKFTWESHSLRDINGNYCGRYVIIKQKRERKD
jgi:PAS domain S-box-containing protein